MPKTRTILGTVAQTLLGGLVVLVTVPTGVGPVAGGWLASRESKRQCRKVVMSAGAGLLGALPWIALVFLATRGAIEPIGYHEGVVHVGIQSASPGTFVLWQEVGVTIAFAGTVVGITVAGGIIAGLSGRAAWISRGEHQD
jgi:hypothetical protein